MLPVLAALIVGLVPAAASADVKVIGTYSGPIADNSVCTAEPEDPDLYGSSAINPDSTADIIPRNDAGVHSDYCVAYRLTPQMSGARTPTPEYPDDPATEPYDGDDAQLVVVDTPLGFAAAASAAPTCSDADFGTGEFSVPNCPNSKVGDARIRLHMASAPGMSAMQVIDQAVTAIYNLEAGPNEAARLGVSVDVGFDVPTKFVVRVVFTGGENNGLRSIVEDPPRQLIAYGGFFVQNLYVESVGLRMYGTNAAHPSMVADAFAETGTQCGTPLAAKFKFKTYGLPDPVESEATSAPHTLTGCEALDFDAGLSVETTEKAPAVPTAAKVTLTAAQNAPAAPTATALLRNATVVLPDGLELGAQAGSRPGGLKTCPAAAFDALAQSAPACAPGTRVGSVEIVSPLVNAPLTGDVFLGPQHAVGELPDLYLSAAFAGATAPDAPRIKLVGETSADALGRVKAVFTDNPQLRFSSLTLNFDGGPDALLSTPRACGTTTGSAEFVPWSGTAPVTSAPSLTIDQDCATPAFAPALTLAAANPKAGAFSPTVIDIAKADRAPWIEEVRVQLPPGLLADLHAATECGLAGEAAAGCPESSRIGTVSVTAGVGPRPLPLTGAMYLTPPAPGAVAGAVIVTRAMIGELDLGTVIVYGRINLRPTDAGLDFIADIPTRHQGLALNLQTMQVNMDRPGFMLNPSSCGPLGFAGSFRGSGGQTAAVGGAVGYGACADLPFQPSLNARLTGEVRPGGHPGMFVEVTNRPGDVAMKATTVVLPDGVATDLKNVQVSCSPEAFHALRCPAETKVGNVVATVAITPEAIPGDVYLVKVPGEVLPGLGLNFTGRFAQRVVSSVKINKQGRIVTHFPAIPDLPLRRLTLNVSGGDKGPLQLPPGECAGNTRWDATFIGHGGQRATDEIGLRCAAMAKVKLSSRKGLSVRIFDFGGRALKSARVTLPKGWSISSRLAKSRRNLWVRGTRAEFRNRFTKRTMTMTVRERKNGETPGATNLRLKAYGNVIGNRARNEKSRRVTVKLRYEFMDGAVQTQEIRVRAR